MIVVLQPRRVAATHGGGAGGLASVGGSWARRLVIRSGLMITPAVGTRICFVTEGILLRWLQDDRTLSKDRGGGLR